MNKFWAIALIIIFSCALSVCAFGAAEKDLRSSVAAVIKKSVLDRHPEWEKAEIKVFFKYSDGTFKTLSDKTGSLSFSVVDLYPEFDPVGDVIIPVQVFQGGKEVDKIFFRTKVEVWVDIIVSSRKLAKKTLIKIDDIKLTKRDIGRLPRRFFTDPQGLIGKETVSSIVAGTVLQDWMVRTPPLIAKGDIVTIVANAENIKASARGEALNDGNLGDKIKVKNLDTKKQVLARVSGSGEAVVEMN